MMWRPNRTTVFKDGSNVSDAFRSRSLFREKKHFNTSLDLIIALRTASDICASNFKWWSTMTPKSLTDSTVGRMVSIYLVGLPLQETA